MTRTFYRKYDEVYKRCISALHELDFYIDYEDLKAGIIEASSGGSIFSWGENIDIKIKRIKKGENKVIVNSYSKAQIIDWGTNSRNERRIINILSNLLG